MRKLARISSKIDSCQPPSRGKVPDLRAGSGGVETCDESVGEWLIWQLADSAFPTGGFAHSCGLEAAWQHGEVRGAADLVSFASTTLSQLKRAAVPFMTATHRDPMTLPDVDQLCDAFTPNHVANRASRKQGQAFLLAVRRIYPMVGNHPDLVCAAAIATFSAHLVPLFGAVLRWLDVPVETTVRLFVFGQLRGVLAAAVRLNIIGPMEAQAVQHQLGGLAGEIVSSSLHLGLDDVAQTAPLLDIWQGAQDRLYSRLFQS
jgi:urease accessory protein